MQTSWIIGAADACDLRAVSPYVSGRHCRLEYDAGQWFVEDLGSTNGTYVNGSRITSRTPVTKADAITLGRTVPMPWPAAESVLPKTVVPAVRPAPTAAIKAVQLPPVGQTIVLGRAAECDVVLDFPMVSARHASIEHIDGGWLVRDLGSTNGTFVGGRRVTDAVEVHSGDVIALGSYRLTLASDGRSMLEHDRRGTAAIEAAHVAVDVGSRRLIGDVSLVVRAGEMVAIMGPSGAGKSTLLAALVGSQRPSSGRVLIGGTDLYNHRDELRGQVGYVPQDDIMHADLTVAEALWYSARLRLPRDYSDTEIHDRIAAVVGRLGLAGTEHTRIGSADRRGISGGQRKRVNVAMELITDPPMLVLDEPTSGLSSTDALSLMRLLRSLADGGKAIVLTIHQPSVEILELLDGVAVIARDESTNNVGTLAWYGPAYPHAAAFFESGQTATPDAEAILRGLEARPVADWRSRYRASPVHEAWITKRASGVTASSAVQPPRQASSLDAVFQCLVLVQRTLAVKLADRWTTGLLVAQAPVIAMLIALVLGSKARAPLDAASWGSVSTALGMTTFLVALAAVWFGCSNAAREIVGERAIYQRERMVGLSSLAYLSSKAIVLALMAFLQCVMLLVIVRLGCGLAGNIWYELFVLLAAAGAGTAVGLALSAFVNTPEAAATALPVVVLPMVILGGSLLPMPELPPAATWLADAMPSRWAFEALLGSEAHARPLLEISDPTRPWEGVSRDLAEPWFPVAGWRVGRVLPPTMLVGLWTLGLAAAHAILVHRERGRGRH